MYVLHSCFVFVCSLQIGCGGLVINIASLCIEIQILLHAPIVTLPGHKRQNSAAELKAWKESRWSQILQSTIDSKSSPLSQQLLTAATSIHDNDGDMLGPFYSGYESSASPPANSVNSPITIQPNSARRITPARFRAIMSRASGRWDVEPVIEMLKDEDNMIPVKHIALYQKGIERLDSLNDDEKEFLDGIRMAVGMQLDDDEDDDPEHTK